MVRKREPKATKADVSDFVSGADNKEKQAADPRAPNDYKKISLSMNQYTYDLLVQAADIDERSLVQTMRFAIQKYSRDKINNS